MSKEKCNLANLSDSFNSLEHNGHGEVSPRRRSCQAVGLKNGNGVTLEPIESSAAEVEFQGLTVLTFLQSSLVQSMALSHKDISPVSQYEGLQVTVEYVENTRDRWPSDEVLTKRQTSEPRSQGHSTHLQCYRSRHTGSRDAGTCCNGKITRSVAETIICSLYVCRLN